MIMFMRILLRWLIIIVSIPVTDEKPSQRTVFTVIGRNNDTFKIEIQHHECPEDHFLYRLSRGEFYLQDGRDITEEVTEICQRCTRCDDGVEVMRKCSQYQDIVCGRKCTQPGYRFDEGTQSCQHKKILDEGYTHEELRQWLAVQEDKAREDLVAEVGFTGTPRVPQTTKVAKIMPGSGMPLKLGQEGSEESKTVASSELDAKQDQGEMKETIPVEANLEDGWGYENLLLIASGTLFVIVALAYVYVAMQKFQRPRFLFRRRGRMREPSVPVLRVETGTSGVEASVPTTSTMVRMVASGPVTFETVKYQPIKNGPSSNGASTSCVADESDEWTTDYSDSESGDVDLENESRGDDVGIDVKQDDRKEVIMVGGASDEKEGVVLEDIKVELAAEYETCSDGSSADDGCSCYVNEIEERTSEGEMTSTGGEQDDRDEEDVCARENSCFEKRNWTGTNYFVTPEAIKCATSSSRSTMETIPEDDEPSQYTLMDDPNGPWVTVDDSDNVNSLLTLHHYPTGCDEATEADNESDDENFIDGIDSPIDCPDSCNSDYEEYSFAGEDGLSKDIQDWAGADTTGDNDESDTDNFVDGIDSMGNRHDDALNSKYEARNTHVEDDRNQATLETRDCYSQVTENDLEKRVSICDFNEGRFFQVKNAMSLFASPESAAAVICDQKVYLSLKAFMSADYLASTVCPGRGGSGILGGIDGIPRSRHLTIRESIEERSWCTFDLAFPITDAYMTPVNELCEEILALSKLDKPAENSCFDLGHLIQKIRDEFTKFGHSLKTKRNDCKRFQFLESRKSTLVLSPDPLFAQAFVTYVTRMMKRKLTNQTKTSGSTRGWETLD
ncbi:uncharacterized protein LOC110975538 [Acanthaster planci]|uniref:Uncharacterized protein LOC110975538 n=1 Tax=Acanthaster planci TaxID=133434 RepID=A0A8B7XUU7_ACAPL|nr:uncharacterized protein LOC110975538 [Acanthaster planci]